MNHAYMSLSKFTRCFFCVFFSNSKENEMHQCLVWDLCSWNGCWPLLGHVRTPDCTAGDAFPPSSCHELVMTFTKHYATTLLGTCTGAPTTVASGLAIGVPTIIVPGGTTCLIAFCSHSSRYLRKPAIPQSSVTTLIILRTSRDPESLTPRTESLTPEMREIPKLVTRSPPTPIIKG